VRRYRHPVGRQRRYLRHLELPGVRSRLGRPIKAPRPATAVSLGDSGSTVPVTASVERSGPNPRGERGPLRGGEWQRVAGGVLAVAHGTQVAVEGGNQKRPSRGGSAARWGFRLRDGGEPAASQLGLAAGAMGSRPMSLP